MTSNGTTSNGTSSNGTTPGEPKSAATTNRATAADVLASGSNAAELKARFTGSVFDEIDLDVDAASLVDFALACGETDPIYTDASHPDFQAVPNYPTRIHGTRQLPKDFPVEMQRCFDAGKSVVVHAPVRAGDKITGRSEIFDIYEKTGRSGGMLFIVHRMNFYNQQGVHLATVDWRLVQREFNP